MLYRLSALHGYRTRLVRIKSPLHNLSANSALLLWFIVLVFSFHLIFLLNLVISSVQDVRLELTLRISREYLKLLRIPFPPILRTRSGIRTRKTCGLNAVCIPRFHQAGL